MFHKATASGIPVDVHHISNHVSTFSTPEVQPAARGCSRSALRSRPTLDGALQMYCYVFTVAMLFTLALANMILAMRMRLAPPRPSAEAPTNSYMLRITSPER